MRYSEKLAKFSLIVSKEKSRYTLQVFHLDVTAGVLVATDGHRLVVHSVETDPTDVTGNIPVEALAALQKSRKQYPGAYLDCSSAEVVSVIAGSLTLFQGERDPGMFPNWKAVLPSAGISEDGAITVAFDAKYLYEIAQAMGASDYHTAGPHTVTLAIRDNQTAITVMKGDEAIGILMPCRTERKRVARFWDRSAVVTEIAAD
jgi:hypothetical protein